MSDRSFGRRGRDRVPIATGARGDRHTRTPAGSSWVRSAATFRGALGLVAALAVWWLVTDVVAAPGDLLARFSPMAAVPALFELFRSGNGPLHVVVTVERLLIGLAAAIVVGVPLGVAVGRSETLAQYTGALFQFLRMVSPLAWTPIAIIVLGVGDAPVYFLVAVAAVWPVLLNAAAGVHALDPGWLQVSRSLGATRTEQLRTIVLPGIRAHLATGVRVALGTAWIVIVPAEMLGVDSGLGYAILDARDRLRYDELMGVILVIGVLGFTLDSLAKRLAVRSSGRRRPTPVAAGGGGSARAGGDHAAGGVEAANGPISRR
jgi:NitT/TauT family transport system permease protein